MSSWDDVNCDPIADIKAMKRQIQEAAYKPDPYALSWPELEEAAAEVHAKVMAEIVMRQIGAEDYGLRLAQVARRWMLMERFEQ